MLHRLLARGRRRTRSLVKESYSTSPTPYTPDGRRRSARTSTTTLQGQHGRRAAAAAQPRQRRGPRLPDGDGHRRPADPGRRRAGRAARGPCPRSTLADDGAPSITPTGAEPPDDARRAAAAQGRAATRSPSATTSPSSTPGSRGRPASRSTRRWTHGGSPSPSRCRRAPWAEGLVEQTVGSQVMLVVPPSYGLGAAQSEELSGETLVFVIDILARPGPRPRRRRATTSGPSPGRRSGDRAADARRLQRAGARSRPR